ncbi:AAA family ATPase [Thiovibrio frasassiensis]|uniref:AAA family ATPase n=1 Tax=Thiovibrio frasassiensis TaxID=2984131 RepID=A0A9X4MFZ4_9BACT|nr:AAA family ATPase [Thiovibrio frasassiensis]MDG4475683.1 AAA family ATPase [Thiovibrio frasassiensis]
MPRPDLFVFFGLIATGKSTVAQAFAEAHDLTYYNSDVVRKELAGLSPQAHQLETADQGIYTSEFSAKTYAALLARAEHDLSQNRGVVLDASYQRKTDRDQVRKLAQRLSVRLYCILCVCPEEEMKRRMAKRALDPQAVSDGRWEIYLKQKERFEAPAELSPDQLITLPTNLPLDTVLQQLAAQLETRP